MSGRTSSLRGMEVGGRDAALPFNINQGSRNRYSPLEATAILSPAIPLPLCLGEQDFRTSPLCSALQISAIILAIWVLGRVQTQPAPPTVAEFLI